MKTKTSKSQWVAIIILACVMAFHIWQDRKSEVECFELLVEMVQLDSHLIETINTNAELLQEHLDEKISY